MSTRPTLHRQSSKVHFEEDTEPESPIQRPRASTSGATPQFTYPWTPSALPTPSAHEDEISPFEDVDLDTPPLNSYAAGPDTHGPGNPLTSSAPRVSKVPINSRARDRALSVPKDDLYHPMPAPPQPAARRSPYHDALTASISGPAPPYRSPRSSLQQQQEEGQRGYPPPRGRRLSESSIRPTPLPRTRSNTLEEGGIPATRDYRMPFPKIMGPSRGDATQGYAADDVSQYSGRSRANSDASSHAPPAYGRRRANSAMSRASSVGASEYELDPDDPRVTGRRPNRIDQRMKAKLWGNKDCDDIISEKPMRKRRGSDCTELKITVNVASVKHRQAFILKFARALLVFGAPSHRIDGMLNSCAKTLEIPAEFVQFPNIILASFHDRNSDSSKVEVVKAAVGLDLNGVAKTHRIYLQVVQDQIGAEEATLKLSKLLKAKPIYGRRTRIFFAFGCAAAICPLAFGGSFLDMWVAGALSALMFWVNLTYACKNPILSNIFELVMALLISFVARALSTVSGGKLFCYQAITSGGVVLILPGFLILVSSLDLASKHLLIGSIKMVYTVVYTLFLSFVLTVGSDIFYLVDSTARLAEDAATAGLDSIITVDGNFTSNLTNSAYSSLMGSFSFTNDTAVTAVTKHIVDGCPRHHHWPWYAKEFPEWTLFILVPAFSFFISAMNMQSIRSRNLLIMVIISACAFAANKYANKYVFTNSEIVSTVGAFVVGVLGNCASRFLHAPGFVVSVTGVLFLVPSGLSATGGLTNTGGGDGNDAFAASLQVGGRMIQVGIGITIGLLFSGLLVYAFGKKKRTALFAF